MTVVIYTDGACKNDRNVRMNGNRNFPGQRAAVTESTGKGGWAWWVDDHFWDSGAVPDTTNNRMEMLAVVQALLACQQHRTFDRLLIVSDSAYVVNCFADQWYVDWRKNGWRNSAGKPVKNRDLWERLLDLYETHSNAITFRHCRGHGKGGEADAPHVAGNHKADRLAVAARKTLEMRNSQHYPPDPTDDIILPNWMA